MATREFLIIYVAHLKFLSDSIGLENLSLSIRNTLELYDSTLKLRDINHIFL